MAPPHARRDGAHEVPQERVEVLGEIVGHEVGAHRGHAAADVDADARRDDRPLGGDDRADGGAEAEVGVGHEGDVPGQDRQARRALGLLAGGRLEVRGPRPEAVGDLLRCHVGL
ncbi:MAG TPA: hypothetical protein PLK47_15335, partial [Plasticicumulans sp.]|nr:hypothetical protein [Plasticicumulans sp.]